MVAADWKQHTRQDSSAQTKEDVRLVLVWVGGPVQLGMAVAVNNLGIVSRGNEVGIELLAVGPELAELQPVVADDAGVWRAAGEVFIGEVVDDPVELVLKIER